MRTENEWPVYKIPNKNIGSGYGIPDPESSKSEDWFFVASAYSDAATLLLSETEKKVNGEVVLVDDAPIVLPAVFLCRQFIELALKTILAEQGISSDKLKSYGHALKKLWRGCRRAFRKLADSITRFDKKAEDIEPAIDELVDLDPDATLLRYPAKMPKLINIRTLRDNILIIELFLMEVASKLRHNRQEVEAISRAIAEAMQEVE